MFRSRVSQGDQAGHARKSSICANTISAGARIVLDRATR
jgi:hypothetical protein